MYKTLHGLVLREVKYKESSKILTIPVSYTHLTLPTKA